MKKNFNFGSWESPVERVAQLISANDGYFNRFNIYLKSSWNEIKSIFQKENENIGNKISFKKITLENYIFDEIESESDKDIANNINGAVFCFYIDGIYIFIGDENYEYNKCFLNKNNEDKILSFQIVFLFEEYQRDIVGQISFELKSISKKNNKHIRMLCDKDFIKFDFNYEEIDLRLNYGSSFCEKSKHIEELLIDSSINKGLFLFHGLPGTGKTSYIRYLINKVSFKKNILYIPPDMAEELSNPKFLNILKEFTNSVLIIEDAETVLQERKSNGNNAVCNLLNLSDGLLSDILKIQVICTFNCNLLKIDKALLREGRLLAEHYFDLLSKDDAQKLVDSLKIDFIVKKDMSLAEIYDLQKDKEKRNLISSSIIRDDKKVGF